MVKHNKKTSQNGVGWRILLGLVLLCIVLARLLQGVEVRLFNPKGLIANEQFNLIIFSMALAMIVAVPTLFLLYFFAWKYRETNTESADDSRTHHSKLFNAMLWAIPAAFMLVLAVIMWPATHRLEPRKTIVSDKAPIRVQVVALRWKWLFIYPEQGIASVNFLQVPEDTPIQFDLTADETPMSSFWIPHWGGQLYAMTGHTNRLNLIADTPGDFPGSTAEINGRGFAGMKFTARASSQTSFDAWVKEVRSTQGLLDMAEYKKLLQPSENNAARLYASYEHELYDKVLMKYQGHPGEHSGQIHGGAEH